MLLSCHQMRSVEEAAFADGLTAESLMEEAGAGMASAIRQFQPQPGICRVHFGKGHNGGDALVAARHLTGHGWAMELHPAFPESEWSPLTAQKFRELTPRDGAARPGLPLVVLDGLLGTGASGALREPIRSAARQINRARREEGARVFALDIPSGLDGDTGASDEDAVCADVTLTVGFAKTGLLAEPAVARVGRLCVIPLGALSQRITRVAGDAVPGDIVGTARELRMGWPTRGFDLHKGDCGRVGIVAGSRGMSGAAILAANACVHSGAGLVTLLVPAEIEERVAGGVTPEVMVRVLGSLDELDRMRFDVLAVGPGLGRSRDAEILALLRDSPLPLVVDADALNALAGDPGILQSARGARLLTPHPGEMQRLDSEAAATPRRSTLRRFMEKFPHVLLLKGARTLVGQRGQPIFHNTTGNPGMASGGMGDVLTGVCAALAGQGVSLYQSACLGAWVCGGAAEIALATGRHSEESLCASAVIEQLGPAFCALRQGGF
jgi:NAD(P)H-hydrate epimerase